MPSKLEIRYSRPELYCIVRHVGLIIPEITIFSSRFV